MHHLWNFKLFGFSLTWKRRKNNSKVSVIFCTKVCNKQNIKEEKVTTLPRLHSAFHFLGRIWLGAGQLEFWNVSLFPWSNSCSFVWNKRRSTPMNIYFLNISKLSLYHCFKQNNCRQQKSLSSQAPLLPTLKYKACVPGQTMQLFVLYL